MAFIKQIKVGNNTYDIHKKVTVTIAAADWTTATIDKTVSGMTVNDIVVVSPAPSSLITARNSVVYCSAIKANALSFTYNVSKPTASLTFTVLWVQAATTDTDKGAIINTVMGGKVPTGTLNISSTLSNYDTYLNNVRYINLGASALNTTGSAISSVSGSGSVNPGTNTISKNSATNVSTGTVTTTKPTSGVYVAVDAATAQNSGSINISASGTAKAGVTTAGYVKSDTVASNTISKSGTASVTVPAKSASTTYIPINAGTIDVTDKTITPSALTGAWDATNEKYVVSQASTTGTVQSTVTTAGYMSSTVGTKNTGTVTISAPANLEIAKATFTASGNAIKSKDAGYIPANVAVGSANTVARAKTTTSTTANTTDAKLTVTASNNQGTGYVTGSNETASDTITLSVSGATVTATSGNDNTKKVTKSVASGTAGTPEATKGTVSNHSIAITSSVTNTTGYITGGTKSGTTVTVAASELVSGNRALSSSASDQTNIDVTNYKTVSISKINSTNVVEKAGSVNTTNNTYTQGKVTVDTAGYISAGDKVSGASFANTATKDITYKDISNTTAAPVLVSDDYLYINKGYTDNVKISLAKLVPDKASADLASNKILSGYSAYNNDGKLIAGNIPTVTPAFDGGALSGNNIGGSQTKGSVTISESGTFFADAAKTNFGVTTTKPTSGTDGTNYLTVHETHSAASGTATGSTTVTRGAVLYNGAVNGYVSKADNTQALAAGGDKTVSASITVTPSVTDNFEPYYIPVSTASATASAGTASATAGTTSTSGLTAGTYQTTATSGYTYSITATGGSASATGGSASASVSKGVTAGVDKTVSGTATGTKTGASSTIYLVKATPSTTNGSASATANAGTASVTTAPTASASAKQTGMTDGVSTTATPYYFTSSASANAGKLTATGGSARAYVTASSAKITKGYAAADTAASTTASDTGTKTGNTVTTDTKTASDSSTIYLKAATCSVTRDSAPSASIVKQPTATTTASSATTSVTGMVTTTTNTGYSVSASATSGSASAASGYSTASAGAIYDTHTAGYLPAKAKIKIFDGASATSTEKTASSAAKTASDTKYIQKGVLGATTSGNITFTPSVSTTMTTITKPSSGTDGEDYFSITGNGTKSGTVTGKASVSTEGYVKSETATGGGATGVIGGAAIKYIQKASITNNTSGGTSSGTINVGKQIKISAGYNPSDLYYTAQTSAAGASGNTTCNAQSGNNVAGYATASVKTGSATTPATTISHAVSVKWDATKGWIATAPATTKSVTPTVSAGWVATGTAGTITLPETSVSLGSSAWSSATAPSGTTPTTLAKGTTYKMTAGYSNADRYYTTQSDPTLSGNASAANVLSGSTFYSSSYTKQTGTMANNGSTGGTISTKAGTVSIPAGYTTGGSASISATEQNKIIATNIKKGVTILGVAGTYTSSLTSGQTGITAAQVLEGYSGYYNGSAEIKGTMTNNGAVTPAALNPGVSYTIPAGYHNGNGKVSARALVNQAKSPTAITVGTAITPDTGKDGLSSVTIPSNATITVNMGNKLNINVPIMSSPVVTYNSELNEGGTATQLNATVGGTSANTINIQDGATVTANLSSVDSTLKINRAAGTVTSDDLIASNIRKGSSILGVSGTYSASSTASDIYRANYAGNVSSSWSTYWEDYEAVLITATEASYDLPTPIIQGASVRLVYNEFGYLSGNASESGAGFDVYLVSESGQKQLIFGPSAKQAANGPHTSPTVTASFKAVGIVVRKYSAGGGETVQTYQTLRVEAQIAVPSGYYGIATTSNGTTLVDISSYQYLAVKKATLGNTYTPSTSTQNVYAKGEGWVKASDSIATISAIPTETKSVALSMASSNQTINATNGKYMTSVTVTKPSTLIASNIKSGVNIAGVIGTYTAPAATVNSQVVGLFNFTVGGGSSLENVGGKQFYTTSGVFGNDACVGCFVAIAFKGEPTTKPVLMGPSGTIYGESYCISLDSLSTSDSDRDRNLYNSLNALYTYYKNIGYTKCYLAPVQPNTTATYWNTTNYYWQYAASGDSGLTTLYIKNFGAQAVSTSYDD